SRRSHAATLLANGKVLITGGYVNDSYIGTTTAEVYDPTTNAWSAVAPMANPHTDHRALLLKDSRVIVTGYTSEIYDPAKNTWTSTGPMSFIRWYYTATVLPDGRVLVSGGGGAFGASSTEIYTPATNSWTAAASMNSDRYHHIAILL